MDLLRACDEMKAFIKTAQKLVETWEQDPDNHSQLEEGLTAVNEELDKFKDGMSVRLLDVAAVVQAAGSVSNPSSASFPKPQWRCV